MQLQTQTTLINMNTTVDSISNSIEGYYVTGNNSQLTLWYNQNQISSFQMNNMLGEYIWIAKDALPY